LFSSKDLKRQKCSSTAWPWLMFPLEQHCRFLVAILSCATVFVPAKHSHLAPPIIRDVSSVLPNYCFIWRNLKSRHRYPSAIRLCSVEIVLQKYLFTSRLNVNCPSGNLLLHNRINILRCLKWVYPLIQLHSVCICFVIYPSSSIAQAHITARY
jgi:hypothetical protein